MTKKFFLLAGIVLTFGLALDYVLSTATEWYYISATIYGGDPYKHSSEETLLLIFAIASLILLLASLIYFIKDFKTNKQWEAISVLAVIGVTIFILPYVIINAVWLNKNIEKYAPQDEKSALTLMFIARLIMPIAITTLMIIAKARGNEIQRRY